MGQVLTIQLQPGLVLFTVFVKQLFVHRASFHQVKCFLSGNAIALIDIKGLGLLLVLALVQRGVEFIKEVHVFIFAGFEMQGIIDLLLVEFMFGHQGKVRQFFFDIFFQGVVNLFAEPQVQQAFL